MIQPARAVIKRVRPLYSALSWTWQLVSALRDVRLDTASLREFAVWSAGGQTLADNNYRFYDNFIRGVVRDSGGRFHFIDVGANDGWFAKVILRFAPQVWITSYEPLLSQHASLEELRRKYARFRYRPVAVGDRPGRLTIREYGTSGLSSLKTISPSYQYADHYSQAIVSEYSVDVVRLDDELTAFSTIPGDVDLVLKVDTQGYELEVLRGAETCLGRGAFKYIIVEVMTVEKYAGGHLYNEVFDLLHEHGYRLWDVNPAYYERVSRRLTEFDAVFERSARFST